MINGITYASFTERYKDRFYIGAGHFTRVFKMFDYANNKYVVIKTAEVKPELKQFSLQNEVEQINQLPSHPNVIRYDACYRFNTGITGDMDFVVIPYFEFGNLERFLSTNKISLKEKEQIIRGILEGVKFLHRKNCIHQNLKANNILIERESGQFVPKIADGGSNRNALSIEELISNSGSEAPVNYLSPEQLNNKKIYRNVDLWALGVIIYRIILGEHPFSEQDVDQDKESYQYKVYHKIVNRILPDSFHDAPQVYQNIIEKCLVVDPKRRAQNVDEILALLDQNSTSKNGQPKFSISKSIQKIKPSFPKRKKTKETPPINSTVVSDPTNYDAPQPPRSQRTFSETNITSSSKSKLKKENKFLKKMSASSKRISKRWIYIPLYTIALVLSCWALYGFMVYDPPKKSISEIGNNNTSTLPADFVECFDENKITLGGTFQLIPTQEFFPTIEKMDANCYQKICSTLDGVAAGDISTKRFYSIANSGDKCFEPLLAKSLSYHHSQLQELPLLGLFYDSGKFNLNDRQADRLDGFIKSYKKNAKDFGLLIIGRASNVGNRKRNKSLSQRRGEAIIKYIKEKKIKTLNTKFVYFGADPPQLDQEIAELYEIQEREYRSISYGGGKDKDFNLRLNQSVLLVIYPKSADPFGLEKK